MKDHRIRRGRLETGVKHRRLTSQRLVPSTKFPAHVTSAEPERLRHIVVIVRRQIDRQREVGQNSMRLIWRSEIGIVRACDLLEHTLLGKYWIVLYGEKLCHLNKVVEIGERI